MLTDGCCVAAEILSVETVVNPLQLYHDVTDTAASLDEIKLLLTIRSSRRLLAQNYEVRTSTFDG